MELVLYILKWGAIGLLFTPIAVASYNLIAKESKKAGLAWTIIAYIIVVTIFVLNEYFDFIQNF